MARRVRAETGRGEEAGLARARGRRPPAYASAEAAPDRPPAGRRRRTQARARGRLRPRPPLVARPDGAHEPAPRRADDPRLARLVRDVEQRRRRDEPDAPAEPPAAPVRARELPQPPARRDEGPGDAALALGRLQLEGLAERELRAGAHGALHARRGERLRRAGRARAGSGADGIPLRVAPRAGLRRLPLRPGASRPRHRRPSSASAGGTTGATRAISASGTRSTRGSSSRSSGATSSRFRRTHGRGTRSRRAIARGTIRCARCSRRFSCTPRCTTGRAW